MLNAHERSGDDTDALMAEIGRKARGRRAAAGHCQRRAQACGADRHGRGDRCAASRTILDANAIDMANGEEAGLPRPFIDRLKLTPARIGAMADGIRAIAELRDPVGEVIAEWDRPNGLHIERVRTPLGVIGVIYREPPQRHGRCRRAVPEGRQCR